MFELANRLRWGAGKAQRKRSAAFMVVSVAVLAGSFFFTLWITKPTPSGSAINDTAPADERALAGQQVATYGELRRAAERVGLRYSTFMHGTIDAITRTNDREVLMYGWLTDP
ncbi:MAG: hypothetical protein ACJ8F3_07910, partial [Xanthobacteraceae bacterium]